MYLKALKRKKIDQVFAGMQQDAEYQEEARSLAAEFEHADWEALELTETLS